MCHIPIFTFPLFVDLIPCSFILISFRLCDASAFIMFPYSVTYNLYHSVFHLPSLIHLSILCHSITLSPSFLSFVLHHSLTPSFRIPLFQLLASPSCSIIIFPTSVHYSLPPHSNFVYLTFCPLRHFLHSLYYPVCHPTPSLVVYSLACNCYPLLPTQSPPSLPQSPTNFPL